jgi:hypothetical protein
MALLEPAIQSLDKPAAAPAVDVIDSNVNPAGHAWDNQHNPTYTCQMHMNEMQSQLASSFTAQCWHAPMCRLPQHPLHKSPAT